MLHAAKKHALRGVVLAFILALVTPANAQSDQTLPAEIDREVERFTGVPIGEVGGARRPADRRLRLAACMHPLVSAWHGAPGRTVRVACEGSDGWHVFVAIKPRPEPARASPVINRGDRITVAVRGRGFSIQQPGEATEAGAIGDWVAIRVAKGQKTISARVTRPGLAVIAAD